ncbi:MAG: PspC domain-containing protein [Chloroflexi bacterium]|nr:PspC domain-containing protein [Chloroflexota bacterium]
MNSAQNGRAQARERLTRSQTEKKLFGVSGGMAEYFNIDPVLIRTAFVVLALTFGSGVILYLALAIIMPRGEAQLSDAEQGRVDRLVKSRNERMLFGVSGGLAKYFDIDPVFIRVGFVALMFGGGAGILLYVILAIVMPNAPMPILETVQLNEETATSDVESVSASTDATEEAKPVTSQPDRRSEGLALLLIIGGTLWLLSYTGIFSWDGWKIAWPIILIGLGSYLLLQRNRKQR